MPIDLIKLGERIKLFRNKMSYSQEDLAEKTGISRIHISYIERGERAPSLETISSIATVLETTIDRLLGGENTAESTHQEDSILWDCSDEEMEIIIRNMKDLKKTLRNYRIDK